jgi:hypothetical protein
MNYERLNVTQKFFWGVRDPPDPIFKKKKKREYTHFIVLMFLLFHNYINYIEAFVPFLLINLSVIYYNVKYSFILILNTFLKICLNSIFK